MFTSIFPFWGTKNPETNIDDICDYRYDKNKPNEIMIISKGRDKKKKERMYTSESALKIYQKLNYIMYNIKKRRTVY